MNKQTLGAAVLIVIIIMALGSIYRGQSADRTSVLTQRPPETQPEPAAKAPAAPDAGKPVAGPKGPDGKPLRPPLDPTKVQIEQIVRGSGEPVKNGQTVAVQYELSVEGQGMVDSTITKGKPFEFTLGANQVIAGFDDAVRGMRVGGKRLVRIPPALGYGNNPPPGSPITPTSVLYFQVELLGVK